MKDVRPLRGRAAILHSLFLQTCDPSGVEKLLCILCPFKHMNPLKITITHMTALPEYSVGHSANSRRLLNHP